MSKIRKRGKSYQIDYFDPTGKRVRKSFKKRKEAEAELGKRVSLIAEGRYVDKKKECVTTLNKLLKKYKENYKDQSCYKNAKRHYLHNIKVHFGKDTLLENIRYVGLETYRNFLRRKPTKNGSLRADASVNREMSCLHHIFTKAVEWEMIEKSPFDKGKSLLLKENNKRLRFLNDNEVKKLLQACPQYLRDIVVCALNTGMRRGEILSLKWSQVRNGFIYLDKTKTKEERQIPINDDLKALFSRIRKKRHFKSDNVFLYDGQIIEASTGKVRRPKKERKPQPLTEVKRSFTAALDRAGIVNFRFHDLRHTFASQVLLRGGDLKDIQELLGHKTMTMTLRYAHLTQEHKRKAVNLLNGLTASENATCHKTVTFPSRSKSVSS